MTMWKTVEKCPRIEVNERGEVRYKDTGKIASTSVSSTGYIQVGVWNNGKVSTFNVHRLVAEAFIPNPNNLPEVNHKDENRANCNLDNLEWCTRKYNRNYGTCNLRLAKIFGKPIIGVNKATGEEIYFESLEQAGRFFGTQPQTIGRALKGKRKTSLGYYWRYAEGVTA